jgi:hypothetical protein
MEMQVKNTITKTVLILAVAVSGAFNAAQATTQEAKEAFRAAKIQADDTFKSARAKCNEMSGNPKSVCIEEAKATQKRMHADAEAKYENTPKAYLKARIAGADADFAVAKERCNAKTRNEKDLCLEEARAMHTKAVVSAKSNEEIREVRKEAAEDKREADYRVEIEKCERLGGSTKEACVAAVKAQYGK